MPLSFMFLYSMNMNNQNFAPVAFLLLNGSDLRKYAWVEKNNLVWKQQL